MREPPLQVDEHRGRDDPSDPAAVNREHAKGAATAPPYNRVSANERGGGVEADNARGAHGHVETQRAPTGDGTGR